MSAYVHALRLLCLCVRVEHYGVWGELVNPLTHCPSSQGWAPECPFPCLFVFDGCGVLVLGFLPSFSSSTTMTVVLQMCGVFETHVYTALVAQLVYKSSA